jgi:hypothetical protein
VKKWVLIGLLVVTGCKRKLDLAGRLDELSGIRDDACRCKTLECAKYQQTAFTAWNFRNDSTDAAKMTESQRERFGTLRHQLEQCLMAAARGGQVGSNN